MPNGCRAIQTTPQRWMTELEMEGQRDPYKAERASAAAAGGNALLVLSKVIMPRRNFDCPTAVRITDCAGSSGAWLQVVFESYACTAGALKTLSAPPPKK